MATSYAMNGTPVETIQWIPPQSASSNPEGMFYVKFAEPQSGSNTPPWNL